MEPEEEGGFRIGERVIVTADEEEGGTSHKEGTILKIDYRSVKRVRTPVFRVHFSTGGETFAQLVQLRKWDEEGRVLAEEYAVQKSKPPPRKPKESREPRTPKAPKAPKFAAPMDDSMVDGDLQPEGGFGAVPSPAQARRAQLGGGNSRHPPFLEIVREALHSMKDPKGCSVRAVHKWIQESEYGPAVNPNKMKANVAHALYHGVGCGKLIKIGARYRVSPSELKVMSRERQRARKAQEAAAAGKGPELTQTGFLNQPRDPSGRFGSVVEVNVKRENGHGGGGSSRGPPVLMEDSELEGRGFNSRLPARPLPRRLLATPPEAVGDLLAVWHFLRGFGAVLALQSPQLEELELAVAQCGEEVSPTVTAVVLGMLRCLFARRLDGSPSLQKEDHEGGMAGVRGALGALLNPVTWPDLLRRWVSLRVRHFTEVSRRQGGGDYLDDAEPLVRALQSLRQRAFGELSTVHILALMSWLVDDLLDMPALRSAVNESMEECSALLSAWRKAESFQRMTAAQPEAEEDDGTQRALRAAEESAAKALEAYEKAQEGLVTRREPLGMDRHRNRYWYFPEDRGRCHVEESGGGAGAQGAGWAQYTLQEEIDGLLASLNTQGVREDKLKRRVTQDYRRLVSGLVRTPGAPGKTSAPRERPPEPDSHEPRRSTRIHTIKVIQALHGVLEDSASDSEEKTQLGAPPAPGGGPWRYQPLAEPWKHTRLTPLDGLYHMTQELLAVEDRLHRLGCSAAQGGDEGRQALRKEIRAAEEAEQLRGPLLRLEAALHEVYQRTRPRAIDWEALRVPDSEELWLPPYIEPSQDRTGGQPRSRDGKFLSKAERHAKATAAGRSTPTTPNGATPPAQGGSEGAGASPIAHVRAETAEDQETPGAPQLGVAEGVADGLADGEDGESDGESLLRSPGSQDAIKASPTGGSSSTRSMRSSAPGAVKRATMKEDSDSEEEEEEDDGDGEGNQGRGGRRPVVEGLMWEQEQEQEQARALQAELCGALSDQQEDRQAWIGQVKDARTLAGVAVLLYGFVSQASQVLPVLQEAESGEAYMGESHNMNQALRVKVERTGEVVWARLQGFPWWPALVVWPESERFQKVLEKHHDRLICFMGEFDQYRVPERHVRPFMGMEEDSKKASRSNKPLARAIRMGIKALQSAHEEYGPRDPNVPDNRPVPQPAQKAQHKQHEQPPAADASPAVEELEEDHAPDQSEPAAEGAEGPRTAAASALAREACPPPADSGGRSSSPVPAGSVAASLLEGGVERQSSRKRKMTALALEAHRSGAMPMPWLKAEEEPSGPPASKKSRDSPSDAHPGPPQAEDHSPPPQAPPPNGHTPLAPGHSAAHGEASRDEYPPPQEVVARSCVGTPGDDAMVEDGVMPPQANGLHPAAASHLHPASSHQQPGTPDPQSTSQGSALSQLPPGPPHGSGASSAHSVTGTTMEHPTRMVVTASAREQQRAMENREVGEGRTVEV